MLRSKTPEMVTQEFWAMLCVYQAIRHLITQAAPPGLDPGRISFKRAITAARGSATQAALPPRRLNTALRHLYTQLRKPANLTPHRTGRSSPVPFLISPSEGLQATVLGMTYRPCR